jgi:hypothetical protein
MQQGYYLRQFGPSYVYVRFRCSRCKKLGEQFIKQDEWQEGLLKDEGRDFTPSEKRRFDRLGKISVEEMIDFHYNLEKLEGLPQLSEEEQKKE